MTQKEIKADIAKMKKQLNSKSLSDAAKAGLKKAIASAESKLSAMGKSEEKSKSSSDKTNENVEHLSFDEAIKNSSDKTVSGSNDYLQAKAAETISAKIGTRPVALYNWANKHFVNLLANGYPLTLKENRDIVLEDIVNDKYDKTKKIVKANYRKVAPKAKTEKNKTPYPSTKTDFERAVIDGIIDRENIPNGDAQGLVEAWEMNNKKKLGSLHLKKSVKDAVELVLETPNGLIPLKIARISNYGKSDSKFTTWKDFNNELERRFRQDPLKKPKIDIEWQDGSDYETSIEFGNGEQEFNPIETTIGEYLTRPGSSFNKTEKESYAFEDPETYTYVKEMEEKDYGRQFRKNIRAQLIKDGYAKTESEANDLMAKWEEKYKPNKINDYYLVPFRDVTYYIKNEAVILGANQTDIENKDKEEKVLKELIVTLGFKKGEAQDMIDTWKNSEIFDRSDYKKKTSLELAKAIVSFNSKLNKKDLVKQAINANTPEGEPDCQELLKQLREQKAKRKVQAQKPAPTPAKTIEKATEVAEKKIEAKGGKISKTQERAIAASMTRLVDSIKGNKDLIRTLIKKLEALL